MAVQLVSTIKSWFETGDKPTQNQFWDWLDSFRHKNDPVAMGDVSGLDSALSGLASQSSVDALKAIIIDTSATSVSQAIPAGTLLNKVRIKSDSAVTFSLGTAPGGGHIISGESLTAGQVGVYSVDFDCEVLTTVYFSGLGGNTNIKIYLLQ